jgi:glycogen operon protein
MDSLRYWVTDMHVDGFRFDLAPALARGDNNEYDIRSPFLSAIAQDPILRETKLIAEPWDAAMGGYQVGNCPTGWSDWNGRYRDTARDFWRSQPGVVGDLATRIAGSSDLYRGSGRAPTASVNFITAHDGFTLRDLVSYNDKHNEANGEENRDGTTDHRSWNLGAEGPTDDAEINARRARQARNFLATLLLSHGVPMLVAGDEMGRTQHGNNNAFCQDNEMSWLNWAEADQSLFEYTRRLIRLRQQHPAFRRPTWPAVRTTHRPLAVTAWFTQAGIEMSKHDWDNGDRRSLGLYLDDEAGVTAGSRTKTLDRFYLMFNATLEEGVFRLPSPRWGGLWTPLLDTADVAVGQPGVVTEAFGSRGSVTRPPLSLLVLRCPRRRLEPVTG